jgi:thioredoxin reductase (NADPH)
MVERGTKFIRGTVPDNIEMTEDNKRMVTWTLDGQQYTDIFDTVMVAVGRKADTTRLRL